MTTQPPNTHEPSSPDPGDSQASPQQNALTSTPEIQSHTTTKKIHLSRKENRIFLSILLLFSGSLFLYTIGMFYVPIVLAATFATLFYPLYKWFNKITNNKRILSSLLCCLILIFGIVTPTYVVGYFLVKQSLDLYSSAETKINEILKKGDQGIIGKIKKYRSDHWPNINWSTFNKTDWYSTLQDAVKVLAKMGTAIINKTSASIFILILNIFIVLFTMFYLFIDGEAITNKLRALSPLRIEYTDMLFSSFALISRATIKGTVIIGLVQGFLGGLTLLLFGIKSWLVWGFVMVVLSILPVVGAWIVLIPAGISQIIVGDAWQGIGIIASSIVVISNIDNLIRPRLVGQEARMHDLLIFFSTIGGLASFGIMGFIVGPVIAALFIAIVDIFSLEFSEKKI